MASKPEVQVLSPFQKEDCKSVVSALQQEKYIALDCEGIHLSSTGPLTLMQIGLMKGNVYLFDVMKNEKQQDKSFFKDTGLEEILTSSQIVKVIHSCSNDSAALFHQFGIKLHNVFDTQVAHLVIEEHKGHKLPYRLKLAEICRIYSDTAQVYEGKEEVQIEWTKRENDYWAKRPLTQEMIDYASGDVTALIPEVYEKQKRYLSENGQMDKFEELVKEEIEFCIDPAMKEKRKLRHSKALDSVLNRMSAVYKVGTEYTAITDEDEIKALKDISVKEISAYDKVIQNLKQGYVRSFLSKLEEDLKSPDTFVSTRSLDYELYDIENNGPEDIRIDASRLRKQVCDVITKDIQRKYTLETPVEKISEPDMQALKYLRPITEDGLAAFHPTVLALHWKVEENDIDVAAVNLKTYTNYDVPFVPKLRFYNFNQHVPVIVKRKAKDLLEKVEAATLVNIPQKYTSESPIEQLSETEKAVLRGLRTSSGSFHPVVVSLHWKLTYDGLCRDLEMYREGKLRMNKGLEGKIFFCAKNDSVPANVKRKANEFLKYLPDRRRRR
ncbi:hypothetical protein CHS0354_003558 [Potamilus streckersoni]|uniref:3'-5' exonuclease domain-containing protein n=1 Tax=Potamilus streckersoni TaxID=2493646 RepID=A0AAE0RVL6_9BIVA|nr:hypothetical protein CHS0354_003558 [Potamilus streckersoni]